MTFILPSFGASAIAAVPGGGGGFSNDYSLSHDGSDDYARLLGLTLSGAFTASFWFNPLSHAMGSGDLFMTKGYDSANLTSETDWKLDYANGGFRYSVYDRTQSWATKLEATHNFSFSANTWYHIMITYDGGTSTSGMGLFVDGVSKTLTTATQNPSFTGNNSTSATAVNIGSSSQWSGGVLTGLIDEVAFWETDQSANIASIYNGGIPDDISSLSPIAWYRMGDSDTGVSNGSSTPTIVSNVASLQNNYALDFDGSNEYISIPHSSSLTISGDMTISAWVYRDSTDAGYLPILTKRPSSVANTTYQFYLDLISEGGKLRFYDGSTAASPSGGTSIPTNQWVHVAISVDSGVTNGTKWYVNGTAESSTYNFSITKSNTEEAMIGRLGPTSNYAKGKIDEVALFNSALSASDVTAIYNGGQPADIGSGGLNLNPTAWWRMGDGGTWNGSNWSIPDASANSNTATSVNMVEVDRVTDTPTANAILTNGPTYSDNVPT
jgi:hypothetical protein